MGNHLDVTSLKFVGVATVDDDDSLHEAIKLFRDDCNHLRSKTSLAQVKQSNKHGEKKGVVTVSEVMYFRSWCLPSVVGRTKGWKTEINQTDVFKETMSRVRID